jgi:cbb3-type cytochrome oxidase subunit 3
MKEGLTSLSIFCFLMLLLGIYLYNKSKEQENDSAKLRNTGYVNNRNIYLKNKAIILITMSSFFIAVAVLKMLFS